MMRYVLLLACISFFGITQFSSNVCNGHIISIVEKRVEERAIHINLSYLYPYFKNSPEEVNKTIEDWVNSHLEDDRNNAMEWYKDLEKCGDLKDPEKLAHIQEHGAALFEYTYKIAQLNERFISFAFHCSSYYHQSAYPCFSQTSFNYDLKNKKWVNLNDVFDNDPHYLEKISVACRESLIDDEQEMTAEFWSEDQQTEPQAENFATFTFSNKHMSFYFDWPRYHLSELKIDRSKLI